MKRFKIIPVVVAALLMVAAVGCTTLGQGQDDYYSRTRGTDRIYVDDPYRGTVILERDPVSGRYYEVNSYGVNDRYYRGYGRTYGNGYYGRRHNNGRYRPGTVTPKPPTQEEIRQNQQNKNESRKKVLGN
jgi:hypothetical protein